MYINKIDELIDKVIDDFYNNVIIKDKHFSKIFGETNFVKYQSDINTILSKYIKTINSGDIKKLIGNEDNVIKVINIVKRYLAYYIFLMIGYFYDNKTDTYINNVVEFSKNQSTFGFKINNFFNADNNSIVIKFFEIVRYSTILLGLEPSKIAIAMKKQEFQSSIEFLNSLGQEFVLSNFKLENLSGNKKEQAHNIIKTLIIAELYNKKEKKDVYEIISAAEQQEGIFTFIDVVVPNSTYVDFNAIENILNPKEIRNGMVNEIYDFIVRNEDTIKSDDISIENKILTLLNRKIVVPVVDDFLLYHKDNEKYEKTYTSDPSKSKKKEDTKIRYIVSKIDNVSEYYSENVKKNPTLKKNIEKQFYVPLSDRKAILVNNTEEIKIINKLHNQGRRSIENNEYYNDLMNYRQYPYVNFKDFKDVGFSLNTDRTIDAVRYTSFQFQTDSRKSLELRIGSKDQQLHIVGLLVPAKTLPIETLKTSKILDIRSLSKKKNNPKYQNGYYSMVQFLRHTIVKHKKHKTSVMWKFDLEKDSSKAGSYEQLSKLNNEENIKLIVSGLYDDMIMYMYSSILNIMDRKNEIAFFNSHRIIKKFEKNVFPIPEKSKFYNLLQKAVYYEKYEKTEKKYDTNEDKFFGLFGDVIKLPKYNEKEDGKVVKIKLEQDFIIKGEEKIVTDAEKVGALCQHFITWDSIMAMRKKNPNKYGNILYEFINQYVIENNEQDYVCKSCGTQLNIKKYINDGVYDKDSDRFVTFNLPMDVPLEDIPEYEKFKTTVRNIDKLLEKMSSIASLPFFVGSTTTIKSRRKSIVKNVMDMLLHHNKNMSKVYKERHEKIDKLYGVSKELSNMFVFELDNNIFIYSSKDKDFYKPIKHNNIIIYTMFMLLIEVSKSQMLYMNGDKTCNYFWFDKYGHYFFDKLKIIHNDKGDVVPIKNYKILCYLIYYISCLITKYKMWYFETTTENIPKKKLTPLIHKIIINSFVDIVNSILEVNKSKKKNYIYNLISNRFFIQLNNLYKDQHLVNILKRSDTQKMSALLNKNKFITTKFEPIKLSGDYIINNDEDITVFRECRVSKYYLEKRKVIPHKYYNSNSITNCFNGEFHQWVPIGGTLQCKICEKKIESLKVDLKDNDMITKNIKYINLRKLSKKYCVSGQTHDFYYDSSKGMNICRKCKQNTSNVLNSKQLDELDINLKKRKEDIKLRKMKKDGGEEESIDKHNKYEFAVVKSLEDEYRKVSSRIDPFGYINNFINLIQSTIGKDVNINNANIFIKNDAYIVDHNFNGVSLDKPIIITDSNKINFREKHPFFKSDVLYYTNHKSGKVDVFYDATTHILLGYKESNKEYTVINKSNRHIIIHYSLENRIKLLGHSHKQINIQKKAEVLKEYNKDTDVLIKDIVSNINRTRILRLKRIITDIQRYVYRLIFNYEEKTLDSDGEPIQSFMTKYYKKLNHIKIKNPEGKDKVFENWEAIHNSVFMKNIGKDTININIDDKYISAEEVSKHDFNGNLILFYIVREMGKLVEYNNNKFTKATIVYFLIDIINRAFSMYNDDTLMKNTDIKRFNYILQSNRFLHDIEQKGHGLDANTEGFYGYKDADEPESDEFKESLEDSKEADDALDIDVEVDYESE